MKLAIIDDHSLIRSGVSSALANTEFKVVAEAASVKEGTAVINSYKPDICLVDINLGAGNVVLVGAREDVGGLGVAHEVHAEVDHVEEVDERAAARHGLGGEPAAEAGDAGAANPFRLAGVDGADGAVGDVVHHRVALGAGAVVEIKHERLLRLFGGELHDGHFLGAEGGGFFAEDVLAGLEGLEGEGRVEFVRDDDGDGVELGELFQHLGDIGVHAGDVVFGGGFVSGALVDVAEGDDLSAGLAETVGVISGHAAGADDGDFSAH